MCNPAIIPYVLTAVGAVAGYEGQRKQAAEFNRAKRQQDASNQMQALLARQQRDDNREIGDKKLASLLQEAETVAPSARPPEMTVQEDKQTASNVRALQAANLLGSDSVAAGAAGNQSEAYLRERADAAARQTERAVHLARLFGANTSGTAAQAEQGIRAIDHRLNQAALDAQRRSLNGGYDLLFDELDVNRARAKAGYDPNKGAGLQALGGVLMSYGMGGIGKQAGTYFGKRSGNELIKNNLF